ncbi:phage major capsid protein, P2 family [Sphingomonas morindae]|uniref:Phage major capsid protein, P2 family n=1 Tax=Sphingomonas morindae TaxID=1541170 RepID=A0ABY4X786_9SPHN|nr:phage major capsid protein, P2 family [Sphingomonas morindae]USI72724.1 phage major capsid protein, P2 family [Sphingomonas morindae]
MRNETRKLFNAYTQRMAAISGVEDATVKYSVGPVVEQKLEEVIQASSDFLGRIQIVPVHAQTGAKVGVGVTRPIASRTNTAGGTRRKPIDPTDTSDRGQYTCAQTNSDTAISYSKLDMWAHRPEFQTLLSAAIVAQQGRDRIMIGWNGTACAQQTDIAKFPLLQDVNFGWLHKIRAFAPVRLMAGGGLARDTRDGTGHVTAQGKIYVGAGTIGAEVDYANLDALVHDATELMDVWHRDDTDLVVIIGRDLIHDREMNIINTAGDNAMQMEARNRILTLPKQVGGKTAIIVPFFPANALLITSLDNLSIYVQNGTRRRQLKDEPALDQIENYSSVNEAYVVEDYGRCALVENVVMGRKG